MVCPRCVLAVKDIFEDSNITVAGVQLGEVEIKGSLDSDQLKEVEAELNTLGFELLDDEKSRTIEKIKTLLIEKVQSGEIEEHFSLNKYLSKHIFKEYSTISKMFSEVEGVTIEQFFLLHKIEKVKEYLVYDELPLYIIAMNLGYSSSQHLSGQFKKFTGMTPGQFRNSGGATRKYIDRVI